jgi:hypothetical protein
LVRVCVRMTVKMVCAREDVAFICVDATCPRGTQVGAVRLSPATFDTSATCKTRLLDLRTERRPSQKSERGRGGRHKGFRTP